MVQNLHTPFIARRANILHNLKAAQGDKSRKGGVDVKIADLISEINESPHLVTTSSCSGRFSIFGEPSVESRARKKKGGKWLFASHDLISAQDVLQSLKTHFESASQFNSVRQLQQYQARLRQSESNAGANISNICSGNGQSSPEQSQTVTDTNTHPSTTDSEFILSHQSDSATSDIKPKSDQLVLRMESFILALEASSIESASCVLRCAMDTGLRESGLLFNKRVLVTIRTSLRLEVPLTDKNGCLMVSPEYIHFLVDLANQKLQQNWTRVQRFRKELLSCPELWAQTPRNCSSILTDCSLASREAFQLADMKEQQRESIQALDQYSNRQRSPQNIRRRRDRRNKSAKRARVKESANNLLPKQQQSQSSTLGIDRMAASSSEQVQQLSRQESIVDSEAEKYKYDNLDCGSDLAPKEVVQQAEWQQIMISDDDNLAALNRWGHGSAQVGEYVYVFGGYVSAKPHKRSNDLVRIKLGLNEGVDVSNVSVINVDQPKHTQNSPSARLGHTLTAVDDNTLVLLGGRDSPLDIKSDVWIFDIKVGSWTKQNIQVVGADELPPRYRHAAAVVPPRRNQRGRNSTCMCVFGGFTHDGKILNDTWLINIKTKTATRIAESGDDIPCGRVSHSLTSVPGSCSTDACLILHGGRVGYSDILNDTFMLSVQNWKWSKVVTSQQQEFDYSAKRLMMDLTSLRQFRRPFFTQNKHGQGGTGTKSDQLSTTGSKGIVNVERDSKQVQLVENQMENIQSSMPPMFSHSANLLILNDGQGDLHPYILFLGGCPSHNHHLPVLLHLTTGVWSHLQCNHPVRKLCLIRHSSHICGGRVFIIGGGAFCFSFGTVFGEAHYCTLKQLINLSDTTPKRKMSSKPNPVVSQNDASRKRANDIGLKPVRKSGTRNIGKEQVIALLGMKPVTKKIPLRAIQVQENKQVDSTKPKQSGQTVSSGPNSVELIHTLYECICRQPIVNISEEVKLRLETKQQDILENLQNCTKYYKGSYLVVPAITAKLVKDQLRQFDCMYKTTVQKLSVDLNCLKQEIPDSDIAAQQSVSSKQQNIKAVALPIRRSFLIKAVNYLAQSDDHKRIMTQSLSGQEKQSSKPLGTNVDLDTVVGNKLLKPNETSMQEANITLHTHTGEGECSQTNNCSSDNNDTQPQVIVPCKQNVDNFVWLPLELVGQILGLDESKLLNSGEARKRYGLPPQNQLIENENQTFSPDSTNAVLEENTAAKLSRASQDESVGRLKRNDDDQETLAQLPVSDACQDVDETTITLLPSQHQVTEKQPGEGNEPELVKYLCALVLLPLSKSISPKIRHQNDLAGVVKEVVKNSKGIDCWTDGLASDVPKKWEKLGDAVLFPQSSFQDPIWIDLQDLLWPKIASYLKCTKIARQAPVANTDTRDSQATLLYGIDPWVKHRENRLVYSLDITKCMFSSGNFTEKNRMSKLMCRGETILDCFAGIGYYTLGLLKFAKARHVYAYDLNPHAIVALRQNLIDNDIVDRCTVAEGNILNCSLIDCVDRAILGLIPSSKIGWETAVKALRKTGGKLHVHMNVNIEQKDQWSKETASELMQIASSCKGGEWTAYVHKLVTVKSYAPKVDHVVLDVELRPVGYQIENKHAKQTDTQVEQQDNSAQQQNQKPISDQVSASKSNQAADGQESGQHVHPQNQPQGSSLECVNALQQSQSTSQTAYTQNASSMGEQRSSRPNMTLKAKMDVIDILYKREITAIDVKDCNDGGREKINGVMKRRVPFVIQGFDIGNCKCWDPQFLMSHDEALNSTVAAYVCSHSANGKLDFVNRNFKYTKMSLAELVQRASSTDIEHDSQKELVYLRSLGSNPRKEPSNLQKAFPILSKDVRFPPILDENKTHSTILRISSPGVQLWTHYDVMDNFLVQAVGRKRIVMYPPECYPFLYVSSGSSSSPIIDIHTANQQLYPRFNQAMDAAVEFDLLPGEVLFIPALWFHNVYARDFSVSVNVFFRHLNYQYAKKDLYGNVDLPAAVQARATIEKAINQLKTLPSGYQEFYSIATLQQVIDGTQQSLEKGCNNTEQQQRPVEAH